MTTIQVRIDEKTKRSAKKILDELRKGLPFRIVTENGLTPAEERAVLKASAEAKEGKNVSRYFDSVEELFESLQGKDK
jgi:antitoxin component of RelBE/YafQ-DinJ toxin-antitoxin module